jgi:hypothetical protein
LASICRPLKPSTPLRVSHHPSHASHP